MQSIQSKVLVSILNWNNSRKTIDCVKSLLRSHKDATVSIKIRIIDNNSTPDEVELLHTELPPEIEAELMSVNTGFAGGQNINLRYAVDNKFDFVWLLNNDTLVKSNTIEQLVSKFLTDPRCGAASPVITRLHQPSVIDFCGAIHTWENISSIRPQTLDEARIMINKNPDKVWAVGTALMVRVATINDIGLLNEDFFAYYEDDDFCERMIARGWRIKIALSESIEHACFEGDIFQRPAYYFYLMSRNAIFFAIKHTPQAHRRFLRLRLIDRSLHLADRLAQMNLHNKSEACLLGLADGLIGRGGAPALNRKVPLWIRALQPIGRMWNRD